MQGTREINSSFSLDTSHKEWLAFSWLIGWTLILTKPKETSVAAIRQYKSLSLVIFKAAPRLKQAGMLPICPAEPCCVLTMDSFLHQAAPSKSFLSVVDSLCVKLYIYF